MQFPSVFSWVQGIVRVRGNTDSTLIGNTGDRLKVDTTLSPLDSYVYGNQKYSANNQGSLNTASTYNPFLLFRNPSGSGKQALITTMFMSLTVDNSYAIFRAYTGSTITADGTLITSQPCNIGSSQASSAMQLYTGPTISALGTPFKGRLLHSVGSGGNLTDREQFILQPNSFFILAGSPSANNKTVEFSLGWAEI